MIVIARGWRDFFASLSIGVIATLVATAPATVLPEGFIGWGIALGAAVYAARETRAHWRKWAALEPLREG